MPDQTDTPPITFDVGRPLDADEPAPSLSPEPDPTFDDAPGGRERYDADAEQKELDAEDRARARSQGDPVDPHTAPAPRWTNPVDAFLSAEASELPERVFKIERANGFKVDILLRALPTPRYNKLITQFTTWRRDKQTGERIQETKDRELKAQLVIESAVDIDFNDRRLWEKFGGQDPHHLVERMFLRGEIERMANMIASLSGFQLDDLEEEAGN